jgi:hypothetical protein
MKTLQIITNLLQDYTKALDEVKTKTLTNSLEYLSDNYLDRGICWALIFKYSSNIELYLDYLPETMHDMHDFWFTPPFKCNQQSHLIDILEKRIEILTTIKNKMEKSQQMEGVTT